jgi:triosephosphate isomerase
MRKKIIAGNWKMNNDKYETKELITSINKSLEFRDDLRVIIAPSYTNLESSVAYCNQTLIEVSAQNIHQKTSGAFTGEISAPMLLSIGVNIVIVGHSERREYFNEDEILLFEKVKNALENKMEVIFCFGEKIKERKAEKHFDIVSSQIRNVLFKLKNDDFKNIILAYEPVWAIGTGETANSNQIQEMHSHIRKLISDEYGNKLSQEVSILYGGSVKPSNANEIFSNNDVDGGLIGGASLNSDAFLNIINSI